MAPTSRVRTLRRTRHGGESHYAPLQSIGEDSVVELPKALSATSTGTQISESPETKPVVKSSKRKARDVKDLTEEAIEKKRQRSLVLLEELEADVEKRCEDLMAEAEQKAKELKMELKVQLMYLPQSVRKMPWKTFIEDFGGSLEKVIQNVKEQEYRSLVNASPRKNTIAHSTPAASNRRISAYETPSFTPFAQNVPGTLLRAARRGETTYSINGSPIIPDTVVKAPAGSFVATFEENAAEPKICIALDADTALDISNLDALSEESRASEKTRLLALRAKVNAILSKFK
ncbi:Cell division protein borealin, partial [Globisporangium splendens]